jgi:hypothetical protein
MRNEIITMMRDRCFRVNPLPEQNVSEENNGAPVMGYTPLSENLDVRIKSAIKEMLVTVDTIVLQTVIQKA